ncbi:MAG TPA: hypothetical protein PK752_19370 [Accumulibacter sp.]|uniref:hypothetical protein n=1 Tax=Accumulibacter sp. TaxID=2053492 RepID=UPI002C85CE16|nr:hypothetical protein [Accumulibacter sp.]HRD90391.1 hypothetical protein [Accumulibacter sp.]
MGEHTGQFGFRLRRQQRAGIHPDEAAEHRKGIDRVVANHEELETARGVRTGGNQPTAEEIDVVGNVRIVKVAGLVEADIIEDPLADLVLKLRGEVDARGVSEVRQFVGQQRPRTA